MTRSPTRSVLPPRASSTFPGAGGLSTRWSIVLSCLVPASPRVDGESTCTCRTGSMPCVGRYSLTRCWMPSAPSSGSGASSHRQSDWSNFVVGTRRGNWPALMRWALVTMWLAAAWRKTWVSRHHREPAATRSGRAAPCQDPHWGAGRHRPPAAPVPRVEWL